jgi:microcystin-dependent protein
MALSTPANISALPSSVTPDVTTGLDTDLIAVYDYLKDIAADVNAEITTLNTAIDAAAPVGSMKLLGTSTIPTGWLLCNDQAVSRTTYADLFAAIGTAYGVGNGSTTFNVPDLVGRIPVGRDSGDTDFDVLGELGGAKTHTLVTGELPAHTHSEGSLVTASDNHTHTFSGKGDAATTHSHNQTNTAATGGTGDATNGTVTTGSDSHTHAITGSTSSVGSDTAHNNVQPYQVVNYIIKT